MLLSRERNAIAHIEGVTQHPGMRTPRLALLLMGTLILFPIAAGATESRRPDAGSIETAARCGEVEIRVSWRWRDGGPGQALESFAVAVDGIDAMSAAEAAQMLDDLNLLTAGGAFYRSVRITCGASSLEGASIVLEADESYYSDADRDLVLIRVDATAKRVISPAMV